MSAKYKICRNEGRLRGIADMLVAHRGGMAFRMSDALGPHERPVEVGRAAANEIAAAIGDCYVAPVMSGTSAQRGKKTV